MTALFLTVLVASLAGSLHCAGMCGAFVAFAIGAADPGVRTSRGVLLALYQVGRLATYTLLGAVAGMLGAGIDLGGRMVGVQRTAAILSGVMMVGFASLTLARLAGLRAGTLRLPGGWNGVVSAAHRRTMGYSAPVRAVATGLLTTLIPCGWLYAFVAVAAGTGHAWSGAALMATFWIGTLPMLTFVGIGVRKLSGAFARKIPAVSASAILIVGLYTIAARAGISLNGMGAHHAAGTLELLRQVKEIDPTSLPCCTTQPTTVPAGRSP